MVEDLDEGNTSPEQKVKYWQEHPVEAARDIFGCTVLDDPDEEFDLDWHQRLVIKSRWVHSTEYDVLSRGTGKTFLNAVTGSLRGMLFPGNRVGFIAPSFRQSKMIMDEMEKLWHRSPIFQQAAPDGIRHATDKSFIKFEPPPGRNGSYIEAMPLGNDGGKIRGARFYEVYADELAQIDNDILNTVVRGFLATSMNPMKRAKFMKRQKEMVQQGLITEDEIIRMETNKFVGSSTAFYQYNHLWERVQNLMTEILDPIKSMQMHDQSTVEEALLKLPKYSLKGGPLNGGQLPYRIMSNGKKCLTAFTYLDPSEEFMNVETINEAKAEMSDYVFRMEYECFFPPDSEGFFRRSILDGARKHREFVCLLEPRKGMKYAMGIDPARNNDNFAVSIFEIDPEARKIHLVRMITYHKKNFPEMHQNIRKLIKLYGIEYFEMDAGGGGTTIRDLLADPNSCPIGEKLILERDFDEHRAKQGSRILGPLIQFSSAEWVHDANHNLLSGLQHGTCLIAAKPPLPGQLWTPELEEADEELEAALMEMSTIVVSAAGSRMRWDTPTSRQRKDRYSAILVGYNAALKVLGDGGKGKVLAMGGWY